MGLAPTGVWRLPPPSLHCNWRTLPSSQTPFPSRPLLPSSPHPPWLFLKGFGRGAAQAGGGEGSQGARRSRGGPPSGTWGQTHIWLAWLPLQSLAVKKNFFLCKFWAVENFKDLLKSAGEIFLSGRRGAKNFSNTFRIVFRIFFRVFQTVFRIDLKVFRGQFRSADVPP